PWKPWSSVVLPQPEGPTTATNSPRRTSRFTPARTFTAPNACSTPRSSRSTSVTAASALVAPAHAGDPGQPHEQPIEEDTDEADRDHGRGEEVDAQAVARVPDCEAQALAARDHRRPRPPATRGRRSRGAS